MTDVLHVSGTVFGNAVPKPLAPAIAATAKISILIAVEEKAVVHAALGGGIGHAGIAIAAASSTNNMSPVIVATKRGAGKALGMIL